MPVLSWLPPLRYAHFDQTSAHTSHWRPLRVGFSSRLQTKHCIVGDKRKLGREAPASSEMALAQEVTTGSSKIVVMVDDLSNKKISEEGIEPSILSVLSSRPNH